MISDGADWSPARIRAAIFDKGLSQAALARQAGLSDGAVRTAVYKPSPAADRAIAELLGVPIHEIWPSRYLMDGRRRSSPQLPRDPNARALIAQPQIERAA